jgi:hypothetical protein
MICFLHQFEVYSFNKKIISNLYKGKKYKCQILLVPLKWKAVPFSFSYVGQEQMKLALILNVIDPKLVGYDYG